MNLGEKLINYIFILSPIMVGRGGRRNIISPIIVKVRSEIRLSGKVNQGNKDLSNSLLFEGSCNLSGFKDLLCSPLDNLCHSTFILTKSRNPVKDKL